MVSILRKFLKKIFLTPIIEKNFKELQRFYRNQFYIRVQSGHTEYMLDLLDIREQFSDRDAKALTSVCKMVLREREREKRERRLLKLAAGKVFLLIF